MERQLGARHSRQSAPRVAASASLSSLGFLTSERNTSLASRVSGCCAASRALASGASRTKSTFRLILLGVHAQCAVRSLLQKQEEQRAPSRTLLLHPSWIKLCRGCPYISCFHRLQSVDAHLGEFSRGFQELPARNGLTLPSYDEQPSPRKFLAHWHLVTARQKRARASRMLLKTDQRRPPRGHVVMSIETRLGVATAKHRVPKDHRDAVFLAGMLPI